QARVAVDQGPAVVDLEDVGIEGVQGLLDGPGGEATFAADVAVGGLLGGELAVELLADDAAEDLACGVLQPVSEFIDDLGPDAVGIAAGLEDGGVAHGGPPSGRWLLSR